MRVQARLETVISYFIESHNNVPQNAGTSPLGNRPVRGLQNRIATVPQNAGTSPLGNTTGVNWGSKHRTCAAECGYKPAWKRTSAAFRFRLPSLSCRRMRVQARLETGATIPRSFPPATGAEECGRRPACKPRRQSKVRQRGQFSGELDWHPRAPGFAPERDCLIADPNGSALTVGGFERRGG